MENLNAETLDFLNRELKTRQVQLAEADGSASRQIFHRELEHLKQRLVLEFCYQAKREGAGETPL